MLTHLIWVILSILILKNKEDKVLDYSAIIVGVLAFFGTALTSWATINKVIAVLEEKISYLQYAVNKHNQVIERTYRLESEVESALTHIDELRVDVHDLMKGGKA